jgi:hypothetical protein
MKVFNPSLEAQTIGEINLSLTVLLKVPRSTHEMSVTPNRQKMTHFLILSPFFRQNKMI